MREFDTTIFMGNGDHSKRLCNKLQRRLSKGLSILSGLQQPSRSESREAAIRDAEERQRHVRELQDIVADIACALGVSRLRRNKPKLSNH